jgi:hypothetical protein
MSKKLSVIAFCGLFLTPIITRAGGIDAPIADCEKVLEGVRFVVWDAPLSTGNNLTRRLFELGAEVHVGISNGFMPLLAGPAFPDGMIKSVITENVDTPGITEAELKLIDPHAMTAGAETGVETNDLFSERLNKVGNGTAYSLARRDKPTQIDIIRKAGLAVVFGAEFAEFNELKTWVHTQIQGWPENAKISPDTPYKNPVRLKPTKDAAGSRQTTARSDNELKWGFDRIIYPDPNEANAGIMKEGKSDTVLAQRFMETAIWNEYIVETVRSDGKASVPIIFLGTKSEVMGGKSTFNKVRWLLPSGDKAANRSLDYVDHVLEVLNVPSNYQSKLMEYDQAVAETLHNRYGPTHDEIWLRIDGQDTAVLNESATRPGGSNGLLAKLGKLGTGFDELEAIGYSYVRPGMFGEYIKRPYTYTPQALVYMQSDDESRPLSHSIERELSKLPGVTQIMWEKSKPEGTKLLTKNLTTIPGKFILQANDEKGIGIDQLWSTYQTYLKWEKEGRLYAK